MNLYLPDLRLPEHSLVYRLRSAICIQIRIKPQGAFFTPLGIAKVVCRHAWTLELSYEDYYSLLQSARFQPYILFDNSHPFRVFDYQT